MKQTYRYNIAIIGDVSVGKSTIVNSILQNQFSTTAKSRTTMMPQVYHETLSLKYQTLDDIKAIKKSNDDNNKIIIQKLDEYEKSGQKITSADIKVMSYNVPRFEDISTKLEDDILLSIYDLPGICDAISKEALTKWLADNFKIFDIVLFVTKIENALNSMEEKELMYKVMELIKIQNAKGKRVEIIPIMNKCDELRVIDNQVQFVNIKMDDIMGKYIDENSIDIEEELTDIIGDLLDDRDFKGGNKTYQPDDEENLKVYLQANKVFHWGLEKYDLTDNSVQNFVPVSAEWAYFLKTLDKYSFDDVRKGEWYNASGKSIVNTYGRFYLNKKEWANMNIKQQWIKLVEFKKKMKVDVELVNTGYISLFDKIRSIIKNNKVYFSNNKFTDYVTDNLKNPESYKSFNAYATAFESAFNLLLDNMLRFKNGQLENTFEKHFDNLIEHTNKLCYSILSTVSEWIDIEKGSILTSNNFKIPANAVPSAILETSIYVINSCSNLYDEICIISNSLSVKNKFLAGILKSSWYKNNASGISKISKTHDHLESILKNLKITKDGIMLALAKMPFNSVVHGENLILGPDNLTNYNNVMDSLLTNICDPKHYAISLDTIERYHFLQHLDSYSFKKLFAEIARYYPKDIRILKFYCIIWYHSCTNASYIDGGNNSKRLRSSNEEYQHAINKHAELSLILNDFGKKLKQNPEYYPYYQILKRILDRMSDYFIGKPQYILSDKNVPEKDILYDILHNFVS